MIEPSGCTAAVPAVGATGTVTVTTCAPIPVSLASTSIATALPLVVDAASATATIGVTGVAPLLQASWLVPAAFVVGFVAVMFFERPGHQSAPARATEASVVQPAP